jgi:hypothetical protein
VKGLFDVRGEDVGLQVRLVEHVEGQEAVGIGAGLQVEIQEPFVGVIAARSFAEGATGDERAKDELRQFAVVVDEGGRRTALQE